MKDDSCDSAPTPAWEKASISDAERVIALVETEVKDKEEMIRILLPYSRWCFSRDIFPAGLAYFEKIHDLSGSDDKKAFCLLSIGQMCERQNDYKTAIEWYRKGLALGAGIGEVRYFLHNNLGYCLNHFGGHEEALGYCQAAVSMNPDRYNAHKNLGIALEGLGRYAEAAISYVTASRLNPRDPRALTHLDDLVAAHPEVRRKIPGLKKQTDACKKAAVAWH